jgi:hypothetical protein
MIRKGKEDELKRRTELLKAFPKLTDPARMLKVGQSTSMAGPNYVQKGVTDLGDEVKGLVEAHSNMVRLDELIGSLPRKDGSRVGNIDTWKPGDPLYGMGATTMLPGGVGGDAIRGAIYPKNVAPIADEIASTYQTLRDTIGYMRSGKVINAEELKRIQKQFDYLLAAKDANKIAALKNFRETMRKILINAEARVRVTNPQALDAFTKGGGLTSKHPIYNRGAGMQLAPGQAGGKGPVVLP